MPGNGETGYLVVGVNKARDATGLPITERLQEQLASLRDNGNIIPMPDMSVSVAQHQGRDILVVAVRPSNMPPVRYKQVTWIRTGPSEDRATQEQERRLEERRIDRSRTWDMRACQDATLHDLAVELFKLSYLPAAVSAEVLDENGRTIEEQLGSLRFWQSKLNCPTNGAILLFGKSPEFYVAGAYVQYVRYEGDNQATAVLEERRITGDMATILRGLDALAKQLEVARPHRNPDLSDSTIRDYPAIALHELFVNAVIHRNYEGSTTPIAVNHYMDRIEIQNPGSLFGDLTPDQFPRGTSYRNPLLAEAAKTLGFANRFGRGVSLARDILAKNASPELTYEIGTNHLAMIVWKRL